MSLLEDAKSNVAPMCRRFSARKGSRRPSRRTTACPTCRSTATAMRGRPRALEDALAEIAGGEGQRVIDMIDKASSGPIKTKWGLAFRDYDDCLRYIRELNSLKAPEGGVVLPLAYTVSERPSYSIVPSNAIWRDPAHAETAARLRKNEEDNRRRNLYFPHVLRDARRIGEYHPGLSPNSPECMDRLGVSLAHLESKCSNFYDAAEVERVFYPEIEKLLLDFFPGATDALVYNHDVFDKDYTGDRTEDQDNKNPGVNARYVNLVHNDLKTTIRPRALPRAAHQEPARTSAARSTTRRKRPTGRCRGGSCL